ncbi:IS66 family insertion sequence element accessory protein TnpA [Leptospira santarosai]|uniref:IS66 family insertion sequence element accessory protein TnpA n=1 Tax=Leptospira santarosai TaxID=28183 RepID=UPI00062840B9
MKKTNIDWPKEFDDFSKSELSQPQYCKARNHKYTTFRYHWERRSKQSEKNDFVEIPDTSTDAQSLEAISKIPEQ